MSCEEDLHALSAQDQQNQANPCRGIPRPHEDQGWAQHDQPQAPRRPEGQRCLIRLRDEPRLTDVTRHEATKSIPQTLPRDGDHGGEWIRACRGEGKTFSPFQIGGLLTEIGLSGCVAVRTGKSLDWDGEKMQATNAPEASKFISHGVAAEVDGVR